MSPESSSEALFYYLYQATGLDNELRPSFYAASSMLSCEQIQLSGKSSIFREGFWESTVPKARLSSSSLDRDHTGFMSLS